MQQQRLSNFYSVLNQTLRSHREATRRLDRFLSTGFNIFRVIRPKENRLSDIIADLLDPSGSHGQQRRFLDAFLRRIIRKRSVGKPIKATTCSVGANVEPTTISKARNGGLTFSSGSTISDLVSKTSLGAWRSVNGQLRDYYHHLKNKYEEDRFCLVYLTPKGRDPEETSIACDLREKLKKESKLICVSYRDDILEWIEECCRLCESDKFRWFLRDFVEYMIDNFPTYDVEANDA